MCVSACLTLDDVAFGIWTGADVFDKRVISMAETWFKLVPALHIYSDAFDNKSLESTVNSSNHLNLFFHETPTFSHYLVGTQWDDKWNQVQNRHLYALSDLYTREPHKAWYVVGDDDTFLFPNSLVLFLSQLPLDDEHIYGRPFIVFDHVNPFFMNPDKQHVFVQGGAGIAIPHKIMEKMAGKLENCTQIFSGSNFASDMRLAACLERFFGYEVERDSAEKSVFRYGRGFHGDGPTKETAPHRQLLLTYHHIVPPLTGQLWMACFTKWTDDRGVDHYIDWTSVAMRDIVVELGIEGFWCRFQFMFRIYCSGKEMGIETQPEPVFGEDDLAKKHPKEFRQIFEGDIVMRYVCDDALSGDAIVFDSFLLEEEGCVFKVRCPDVREYPVTFNGIGSPLNVTRSPVKEL